MAWYVDTSAFLKLVVAEHHSGPLRRWAEANDEGLFSSDLMRVEALRSARRHSPSAPAATRDSLDAVALLPVTRAAYDLAAELDSAVLRTLDALHLAVALGLANELEGVATYDDRLASAAALYGVAVAKPMCPDDRHASCWPDLSHSAGHERRRPPSANQPRPSSHHVRHDRSSRSSGERHRRRARSER